MKNFTVIKWFPEDGLVIDIAGGLSENEADKLCNKLESERAPGKPYCYRYKENK